MFSVKKVRKHEYAHLVFDAGKVKVYTATAKGWAIVDENDIPICYTHEYSGKAQFDVFDLKGVAQHEAHFLNRNAVIELLPVERYE